MITVTTTQKEIILKYFKYELSLLSQYETLMVNKTDKDFKYFIFKNFIFSAAGMVNDIDEKLYKKKLLAPFKVIKSLDNSYTEFKIRSKQVMSLYFTEFLLWQDDYVSQTKRYENLKAEIQILMRRDIALSSKLKVLAKKMPLLIQKKVYENELEEMQKQIKRFRSEQVDAIHYLGQKRYELEIVYELLSNFEEAHKQLFVDYFIRVKHSLDTRYNNSLDYFGFKFNLKLFKDAIKSPAVQKFKLRSNIQGKFSLCKYVQYYLKNISPDEIFNEEKKQYLSAAKRYCKNQMEKELLF
ncbi:MAG TPA: hypothetical protein EYO73_09575 [Sulfurimonas sp.]|nr:hypothetical protein [Sulfurimonas sp.]